MRIPYSTGRAIAGRALGAGAGCFGGGALKAAAVSGVLGLRLGKAPRLEHITKA